jgi:hypothetical protein
MKNTDAIHETHPLFPSGEWEGFYSYPPPYSFHKGQMSFYLFFHNQTIEGEGMDEVGKFSWKGTYDTQAMTCQLTKYYHGQHSVYYNGQVDENGIWGSWIIQRNWQGGFHIWPKAQSQEEMQTAIEALMEEPVLLPS